jgi:hypothetical protein
MKKIPRDIGACELIKLPGKTYAYKGLPDKQAQDPKIVVFFVVLCELCDPPQIIK